ncbi:formate dehydrogenase accessory sulfurtransferase FdhD [Pollutibacter soli]|uniref:formate dehydrogenase accessory sulfurtransferase FdhD n=1 Tax=Pollutibacter soli TaxID=3034157 RepID=UPI003013A853
MQNDSVAYIKMKKVSINEVLDADDELAIEEPLEINVRFENKGIPVQKCVSITMRTPGNDEELGVGFLFTEGIIQKREDVADVSSAPVAGNKVLITLNKNKQPLLQNAERNFYTTSSCGVCGKTGIDAIRTTSVYKNDTDEICLPADLFYHLNDVLRKKQAVFESTGGLHASALFDLHGNFTMLREDVGRHNALDKVIGTAFLNDQLPLNNSILLLSGRASFELVQKATMAGIKIIAAIGAPSSLAVQLAEETGITLIGFLRNQRFNIYSGEQRIRL